MRNKKIRNTSEDYVCDPASIEAQEAQGALDMIDSGSHAFTQLPALTAFASPAENLYWQHSIKVLCLNPNDPLFYTTVLPKGWQINPTTHPLWTELVDDKDKTIALIFYKAAFYDMAAFISFTERRPVATGE